MFELSKNGVSFLEEEFEKYPHIDRVIQERKRELNQREIDINIGGGRSNIISNPVETQVIREMSDPVIMYHQKLKNDIESVLDQLNDEQYNMVQKMFLSNEKYDWLNFGFSKKIVMKKRYKILELLAIQRGML